VTGAVGAGKEGSLRDSLRLYQDADALLRVSSEVSCLKCDVVFSIGLCLFCDPLQGLHVTTGAVEEQLTVVILTLVEASLG